MQYMGSKRKIAKEILPIILRDRKEDQLYVEPFMGGCNMLDKVRGRRLGNDHHPYLVAMWKALQLGWVPPTEVSRKRYYEVKANPELFPAEEVGFIGFPCSFGCKWWGGYASNKEGRNYALVACRSLLRQIKNLLDVQFADFPYRFIPLEPKSVIYCDPPYEGTTSYAGGFDHADFWQWCRELKAEGHQVFVSEYNAPPDFTLLHEVRLKSTLDKNSQYERVEKLFCP